MARLMLVFLGHHSRSHPIQSEPICFALIVGCVRCVVAVRGGFRKCTTHRRRRCRRRRQRRRRRRRCSYIKDQFTLRQDHFSGDYRAVNSSSSSSSSIISSTQKKLITPLIRSSDRELRHNLIRIMAVEGQRFMTKTQHYRKVTKPLLERKRRARMNLYLDELKDLIVDTMDAQGEQVSKLEKADILELTVNYLKTQQQQRLAAGTPPAAMTTSPSPPPGQLNFDRFRAGYTQAAYEVSHIFSTVPGVDLKFGTHLMKQLGHQLKDMKQQLSSPPPTPDANEPVNLAQSQPQRSTTPQENPDRGEDVWRPW